MKLFAYIDCGSGVAGDMLMGALAGLGLPVRELNGVLHQMIEEKGWALKVQHTERGKWPAWSVTVEGDRPFGSVEKMRRTVQRSKLPILVKQRADAIFVRFRQAEEKAHGSTKGHFDRDGLGLLDTLVDVVGCVWGFWRLGLDDIAASSINTGRLAPASSWMLQERDVPVYSTDSQQELATPTGVAILCEMAKRFGPMPVLRLKASGYGAGFHERPGRPNVLAIYQGQLMAVSSNVTQDQVVLLETIMDDMDPRLYPHVSDLLFQKGVLDVWWAPVGMKKGRPGIAFSVLCRPDQESSLVSLLFRETTTLGIRRSPLERWILPRTFQRNRKIAHLPDGSRKSQTEFERVKIIARDRAIPLQKLLK